MEFASNHRTQIAIVSVSTLIFLSIMGIMLIYNHEAKNPPSGGGKNPPPPVKTGPPGSITGTLAFISK